MLKRLRGGDPPSLMDVDGSSITARADCQITKVYAEQRSATPRRPLDSRYCVRIPPATTHIAVHNVYHRNILEGTSRAIFNMASKENSTLAAKRAR
jgi:DUF1365 family protein